MSRIFLFCLTLAGSLVAHAQQKTLSVACGAVGTEYEMCKSAADQWSKSSGVAVKLVSTPNDTNQKLALFQQLLSAQSADIDVFLVDIVWPGVLGQHFEDLSAHVPAAEKAAFFDNLIANDTVAGRLVALPMYVDTGVIYYRADLLKKYGLAVPQTWEELTSAAQKIQEGEKKRDSKFVGFVFQGKAYEGLTCNVLEWTGAFGGNAFVDGTGKVVANTPENLAALKLVSSWVGGISPKGVLNYAEEEARGVFQSGGAAFMRNWPYAWQLLNSKGSPVAGKVGVMATPKGGSGGKHSPVLGGWHLAVSKYSKNKNEAVSLVRFLASEAVQRKHFQKYGFFPTLKSLYADKQLAASSPVFGVLATSLSTAIARPSRATGTQYNRVSNEIWNSTFSVLSGKQTAEEGLKDLDRKLVRASRGGKWN
jgi:trehalose/maltose transport system substrate-binding protein